MKSIYNISSKQGLIYVGDPCYIMNKDFYNEWINKYEAEDGKFEINNCHFAVFGTKHGDGIYYAKGPIKKYGDIPVDSGTIASVPYELWSEEAKNRIKDIVKKAGVIVHLNPSQQLSMEIDEYCLFDFDFSSEVENQERNDLFVYDRFWIETADENDYEDEEDEENFY